MKQSMRGSFGISEELDFGTEYKDGDVQNPCAQG